MKLFPVLRDFESSMFYAVEQTRIRILGQQILAALPRLNALYLLRHLVEQRSRPGRHGELTASVKLVVSASDEPVQIRNRVRWQLI